MNAILAAESSALATEPNALRLLSAPEFQRLAAVPPEARWFANLGGVQTRRAY